MSFILGITLDRPALFAVAGILLLIVLGSLVWMWRRRRSEQRRRERRRSSDTEEKKEELQDLGIMEIRPKASEQTEATPVEKPVPDRSEDAPEEPPGLPPEPAEAERAATPPPAEASAPDSEAESMTEPDAPDQESRSNGESEQVAAQEEEPKSEEYRPEESATSEPAADERDAMAPLLQSLQAAVDARTVALLKQEDLALEYEVTALVSTHTDGVQQAGDTFSTNTPLLTAGMTQRAVTVQRVGEMALPLESLGYYDDPADVRQVMIAPLKRSSDPASYFLLADTAREGGFNADPPRKLIARYADLMTTLLAREEAAPSEPMSDTRPRREIIDEEMEAARADDRPLALALIYLNRAEALADEGDQAVASAEQALRQRLEEAAEEGRVERFGELTYGVFYPAHGDEAEAWAMQLQSDLDKERGRLEGGVSVGVAVLSERHESPGALRTDATEALREAYTTGTCTILE